MLPADATAWEQVLAYMEGLYEQGLSGKPPHHWKREDVYKDRLNRYDQNSKSG